MAATFDGDVADLEAVRVAIGAPRVAVIGYDYYAAVCRGLGGVAPAGGDADSCCSVPSSPPTAWRRTGIPPSEWRDWTRRRPGRW